MFPIAFDDPALVGGARPDEMDWYVLDAPGWFLAEGWALTPETSGVADRDKKGPGDNQAVGYVRRRPGAVQMMIGGRNLGAAADPAVRFIVALDGRTWRRSRSRRHPASSCAAVDAARAARWRTARHRRRARGPHRWAELTARAEGLTARVVRWRRRLQPVRPPWSSSICSRSTA